MTFGSGFWVCMCVCVLNKYRVRAKNTFQWNSTRTKKEKLEFESTCLTTSHCTLTGITASINRISVYAHAHTLAVSTSQGVIKDNGKKGPIMDNTARTSAPAHSIQRTDSFINHFLISSCSRRLSMCRCRLPLLERCVIPGIVAVGLIISNS